RGRRRAAPTPVTWIRRRKDVGPPPARHPSVRLRCDGTRRRCGSPGFSRAGGAGICCRGTAPVRVVGAGGRGVEGGAGGCPCVAFGAEVRVIRGLGCFNAPAGVGEATPGLESTVKGGESE